MESIAIIGMSCRFAGSDSAEEYWDLLVKSKEAITLFPKHREVNLGNGTPQSGFKAGFLKCPIDEFDAEFFGISPREAEMMDPQQRLVLEVAWESLENANIEPGNLRGTETGVFLGIWQLEYERLLSKSALEGVDLLHSYLGNAFCATCSRISNFLGLKGPTLALESGCAASLCAIHHACMLLRNKHVNTALAGGINLILGLGTPFLKNSELNSVLSKDYQCRTFDKSANGYVRGEGCGVIVLKRLEDARNNKDNIIAIIRGSAVNDNGDGRSFGTPNGSAQEMVLRKALQESGLRACDISLLEAHGTATVVGMSYDL